MLGNLGHNMVLLLRSLIINDISDDQQLMGLCSNATVKLIPSPSASSKFGSSIFNFFKHAQFFVYTQNYFGILNS